MNDLLIMTFIFLGSIVMSFAIVETRKIFQYVSKNQYLKGWRILWFLMIFFLLGYAVTLILFLYKSYDILLFLTGLIFFFGAIFVFLVVKLGILTIKDLVKSRLTQLELQKEKETAEAINKGKSVFLAMMSHEIRTPMNAILGMTNLLLDTQVDNEQRELLEIVKSSGDSLLVIINDILDFSKIEAGKITLEETCFSLKTCIEQIIDLVELQAHKKGLSLNFHINENVPDMIQTDGNRLRQVLLNLINNAIKFTDKGQVILTVAKPRDNQILFSIQDTGIGISGDNFHKLFQPFSQIDSSASRKFEGTGLGLAISKKLVEIMGGRIWAESQLGEGTTFSFTITAKTYFLAPNNLDEI